MYEPHSLAFTRKLHIYATLFLEYTIARGFEDGGRNNSTGQMLVLLLSTLIDKVKACT